MGRVGALGDKTTRAGAAWRLRTRGVTKRKRASLLQDGARAPQPDRHS